MTIFYQNNIQNQLSPVFNSLNMQSSNRVRKKINIINGIKSQPYFCGQLTTQSLITPKIKKRF